MVGLPIQLFKLCSFQVLAILNRSLHLRLIQRRFSILSLSFDIRLWLIRLHLLENDLRDGCLRILHFFVFEWQAWVALDFEHLIGRLGFSQSFIKIKWVVITLSPERVTQIHLFLLFFLEALWVVDNIFFENLILGKVYLNIIIWFAIFIRCLNFWLWLVQTFVWVILVDCGELLLHILQELVWVYGHFVLVQSAHVVVVAS